MVKTVLYAEKLYDDDKVEREVFGADVRVVWRNVANLSQLEERDCAEVDGLMVMRHAVTGEHLARFPRLGCVVRMGVGYDKIDRKAADARKVMVCNVPDYGTTEVADHALALALSLRRGIALHLEAQRRPQPAPWSYVRDPLLRRNGVQTFGIVGLGRIGTAAALRAKAFQFRVVAYDPHMPNGTELGVGVERGDPRGADGADRYAVDPCAADARDARHDLARHAGALPKGGVVVNTARGPIVDVDALADLLKRGHLAGVGLDVLPVEPPVEPIPELLRAYRAREPWCEGRLIITPHSAFFTPEAWADTRLKAAETMRAALVGPRPQNVITPEMF